MRPRAARARRWRCSRSTRLAALLRGPARAARRAVAPRVVARHAREAAGTNGRAANRCSTRCASGGIPRALAALPWRWEALLAEDLDARGDRRVCRRARRRRSPRSRGSSGPSPEQAADAGADLGAGRSRGEPLGRRRAARWSVDYGRSAARRRACRRRCGRWRCWPALGAAALAARRRGPAGRSVGRMLLALRIGLTGR